MIFVFYSKDGLVLKYQDVRYDFYPCQSKIEILEVEDNKLGFCRNIIQKQSLALTTVVDCYKSWVFEIRARILNIPNLIKALNDSLNQMQCHIKTKDKMLKLKMDTQNRLDVMLKYEKHILKFRKKTCLS